MNNETFPDFSFSESSLVLEAGVDLEEKLVNSNSVVLQSTVEASGGIGIVTDIERFSDLERLLRAFFVRFVSNLKKIEGVYGELAIEELVVAEKLWVKYEQSIISIDKLKLEKLKNSLDLFYDDEKFVRSKTRMGKHLKLVFDNKNPLLLRSNSYFTKLSILRSHKKVFHSELEATLSNVSMRYWITKGTQTVKTVLKNCFICNLVKGKFIVPPKTLSLPNFRVNCSFAFKAVGVDFAGPLYVKDIYSRNENLNKCYLLLFTCATTRALHLEITQDVSANTLILGIHGFMARRGNPGLFISDNFKSFKSLSYIHMYVFFYVRTYIKF